MFWALAWVAHNCKPSGVSLPQHGLPTGHSPRGLSLWEQGSPVGYSGFFSELALGSCPPLHRRAMQGPCCSNPVISAHCTTHSPFIRNSISSPPEESGRVQADRSNLGCFHYNFQEMLPFPVLPRSRTAPGLTVHPSTPKTAGTADEFGIVLGIVKSRSCSPWNTLAKN